MVVKRSIILSLLVMSLLFAGGVSAQRQQFTKTSQSQAAATDYQYTFRSLSGQLEVLKFTLDGHSLEQSRERFSGNKRRALFEQAKKVSNSIYSELQNKYDARLKAEYSRYLQEKGKQLPDGFKLDIKKAKAGWHLSYNGHLSQRQVKHIVAAFRKDADSQWEHLSATNSAAYKQESRQLIIKTLPQIYRQNFYVARQSKDNKNNLEVRIDFAQVIMDETLAIRPLASAIADRVRGLPDREVIAYALHFLQLIPYDNLKPRNALDSTGFVAPLTLIDINKGDCDTKSAALAALIRNLLPDIRIAMVLVPGHAFLALDIPAKNSDSTINVNGRNYVIVEPTGPALSPVGRAHPETRPYLTVEREKIKFLLNIPSGNENNIASVFRM